jgi:hypothetical protein
MWNAAKAGRCCTQVTTMTLQKFDARQAYKLAGIRRDVGIQDLRQHGRAIVHRNRTGGRTSRLIFFVGGMMKRLVLALVLIAAVTGCASGTTPFNDSGGVYAKQNL